jgi:hypothetical protein
MSARRQSIFFNPTIVYDNVILLMNNIMGSYFVSIKPPKSAPKTSIMSSMSGMFSSNPPAGTTLYYGKEPYYLFEKDESQEEFKQAGFRHVEIPLSEITNLNKIIPDERNQLKIQVGGVRRTSRTTKKSKQSKKSRKSRRHH